jgi:hypothetical protein
LIIAKFLELSGDPALSIAYVPDGDFESAFTLYLRFLGDNFGGVLTCIASLPVGNFGSLLALCRARPSGSSFGS